MHVFGVQRVAACDQCGSDDHRVTFSEPVSFRKGSGRSRACAGSGPQQDRAQSGLRAACPPPLSPGFRRQFTGASFGSCTLMRGPWSRMASARSALGPSPRRHSTTFVSTNLPLIRGITAKPLGGGELSTKVPETFQHLFGVGSTQDSHAVSLGQEINLVAFLQVEFTHQLHGQAHGERVPHLEIRIPTSSTAGYKMRPCGLRAPSRLPPVPVLVFSATLQEQMTVWRSGGVRSWCNCVCRNGELPGELVIVRRFANPLNICLITTPEKGDLIPDFGHAICIPHGPSRYIRSVPKPASPVSRERGTRRKQLGLMANSCSRRHPKRSRTA